MSTTRTREDGPSHLDPSVFKNVDVANALRVVRPTLGDNAGIVLYRLLRLVALEDIIGRGAAATSYRAGKKLGGALGLQKLEDFLALCHALKIGIIKVPLVSDTRIHVDVYECVTCSGLETVGRPLCHFEGGLVAGAVESILKKRTRAQEVTCIGGLGDKTCGFELELRPA
jgi:predicted hydrocarbon binding protein